MKKRPFLAPLAALAAALTSGQSTASVLSETATPTVDQTDATRLQLKQGSSETVNAVHGENVFSFVLSRGEGGQMMAYHSSHSSHASHSSHRSHYSGS